MGTEFPGRRRLFLSSSREGLSAAIRTSLEQCGIVARVAADTRVALKPNLTYPFPKQGVTTSTEFIREVVKFFRERTRHVAIVESDGGYGAWTAAQAFAGHGLYKLREEFGVEVVNLGDEDREMISFQSRWGACQLPLPKRLLHQTDLFITLPVPKVHCMTKVSLSYKNQWGCIPDPMRLRRHYIFEDAIVAINRALRPAVLADGTYFLNYNGPMEGHPVRADLVIAATDAGTFDRYVSELMGFRWQEISHLRRAVALGDMPANLEEVVCNVLPQQVDIGPFYLRRTLRNWIALSGFHSRFLTWFGYESWFGRVVLHAILYAIAGRPVKPRPEKPAA